MRYIFTKLHAWSICLDTPATINETKLKACLHYRNLLTIGILHITRNMGHFAPALVVSG